MKFIHTAFVLLFFAPFLAAQTIEIAPVQGNPVLKSFAAKKAAELSAKIKEITGSLLPENMGDNRAAECPPELDGYFVVAGDSIEIELDTFGLMNGTAPVTLTVSNAADLQFGSAVFDDTMLLLTYKATPGFMGAGIDTVKIKLAQADYDTIVPFEIYVKRKDRVVVVATQTVEPESVTEFCLGNEIDFARPKNCTRLSDCPDDYDGNGEPIFYIIHNAYPDSCMVYVSGRFPGVDTVCMKICDDWGVCDVFKIPFRITGDTLSIATLPFFDDFSAYPGPYPSSKLWLDKDVFLNYTLAKDPPSVGLVTFDGIDSHGDNYNIVNGVGDQLTSKAIDLSNYTAASNVFLRFFLAPKGYGLPPSPTDKVTLEFRNANRQWVTVGTYDGMDEQVPIDSNPPFQFYAVKVDEQQFFHEGFQFRFSVNTSPGGAVDLWHLDYVQLSKNEGSDDNFSDIAFTQLPTSILKNYTAMPWKHFDGHVMEEVQDHLQSHFYNHFPDTEALTSSSVTFREKVTGTPIGSTFTVVESGTDNNIPAKVPVTRDRTIPAGNFTQIKSDLEAIPPGNLRLLETTYAFTKSSQAPIFTTNDTVRLVNEFSNYFAHDDGTAEWQLFFAHAQSGEQFAAKFHANVEDEMKAVQLMFPHVGGSLADQEFNLKIWVGSLDSDPVLVRNLLKPYYASDYKDSLQGFTTYLLEDLNGNPTPVTIPADSDFYVGFQQASAATQGIPLGFDVQNPCNCTWVNPDGNEWSPLSANIQGALMIRPVFGEAYSTNSGSHEVASSDMGLSIYPNPSNGIVNFSLRDGSYQDFQLVVFNNLGQQVYKAALAEKLDFSGFKAGVYHLQFLSEKTGAVFSERLILAKD
jgi:hypothetical protein